MECLARVIYFSQVFSHFSSYSSLVSEEPKEQRNEMICPESPWPVRSGAEAQTQPVGLWDVHSLPLRCVSQSFPQQSLLATEPATSQQFFFFPDHSFSLILSFQLITSLAIFTVLRSSQFSLTGLKMLCQFSISFPTGLSVKGLLKDNHVLEDKASQKINLLTYFIIANFLCFAVVKDILLRTCLGFSQETEATLYVFQL